MPLSGLRVLDVSDHAGALCSRLLADFGAEVVRVERPGGAPVRRLEPRRGGVSLAHLYANAGKRVVEIDPASADGHETLRGLVEVADVVVDATSMSPGWQGVRIVPPSGGVLVRVTPFGSTGPRAAWLGSDLVCTARGGMTYVNGPSGAEPISPSGLAGYASAGLVGAVAALAGLAARDRTGRGSVIDLSVAGAVAGAVEHVTGLLRQTGRVQRRQGTLHWSRTFRIGAARDGLVLLTHLGDWTTLSEWVASECAAAHDLTDPRWQDVAARKEHAEEIFDRLDEWLSSRTVEAVCDGARLRRLPFAPVRRPEEIAAEPQLVARGAGTPLPVEGDVVVMPRVPCRFSACAPPPLRLPGHGAAWPRGEDRPVVQTAAASGARALDGIVVLDFSWVVAGPVATRTLADQGARVVKVEHRNAPDFGTRRGGLTGNLNRGKQSIVIDMETPGGRDLAHRLAARADVVIDNFSARVIDGWGLDHASLCRRRADAIQVRLTGFGLDGPAREQPSYGPTLQALVGYPYLMRAPDGAPVGWGYSWSDMAAGLMAAAATLAALRHRDQTGEGQLVDLSQLENLVALLGPEALDFLAGRPARAGGREEGLRAPHGVFRCAPEDDDDDRWLAVSVEDDAMWTRLAGVLVEDGEGWAGDPVLGRLVARRDRSDDLRRRLSGWTRRHRAEELEERLQGRGVAAGLVANGADLELDPQLAVRGFFEEVSGPRGERFRFDGVPFLTDLLPGRVAAPGPLCGEHTDSVLSELLGLGSREIQELREQEVIG